MKIELTSDSSLLLFLEKADMENLHLDIETMLYSDEHTREILRSLYDEARESTGFEPQDGTHAMIEVLPFEDGSCIICFSFPKSRLKFKIIPHLKRTESMYEFSSLSDFEMFRTAAEKLGFTEIDKVYENEGTYRALISTDDERIQNIIREFSVPVVSPLAQSMTDEYWVRAFCSRQTG